MPPVAAGDDRDDPLDSHGALADLATRSGGATTTIRSTASTAASASIDQASSGRPPIDVGELVDPAHPARRARGDDDRVGRR